MARIRIYRKDGRQTPYFWSDKDPRDRTHKTVFRRRAGKTTRMRGVHFNVKTNKIEKA